MIKDRFIQMFTGRDNQTIDIGRVIWFEAVQAYVAISIYSIYKGGVFDAVTWGAGLAALLGAGGAALGFKANVEPSEALTVKTDKMTFQQAVGRPMPPPCDDGGCPPPPPSDDDSSSSDDNDAATPPVTATATSTTTTQTPVPKPVAK